MNSTLASSLTPRCTGTNGTYICQLPAGHKTLHRVTRNTLNSRNIVVPDKSITWIDAHSEVHVKTIRTASK